MAIPRAEYPRPQLVRADWCNLNGAWEYDFDPGKSGRERGLPAADRLSGAIQVPFCPESRLSGLAHTDFIPAIWYRRTFTLPAAWEGSRILLHFGAVDYDTEVWINGVSVGTHRGGYSSFTLEITQAVRPGENVVTVCAEDDTRSPLQPSGKQSDRYASYGCMYTRTTGIWQTVWLEAVPQQFLERPKITPDPENGVVLLEVPLNGRLAGATLRATAYLDGEPVGQVQVQVSGGMFRAWLALCEVQWWSPATPTLYQLTLELLADDRAVDTVESYFGLRSITLAPPAILLNGQPVFQRLILDQGFYPEGIYTAPTDAELRADIERSQAMGFNGARLHEKVFEERFLYWADKLGYLVWGEMANWGLDLAQPAALERFQTEWLEILNRDYNHPSLVGWCPFNETQPNQHPEVLRQIYHLTKRYDTTRPVIDASGWQHVVTDIYDVHDYEQRPEIFAAHYAVECLPQSHELVNYGHIGAHCPHEQGLYMVSEFGGIWWNPGQQDAQSWGYGDRPHNADEFIARYRGLVAILLNHPRMCGFCYTQLTDVEQEVNGLYTYDRQPKFPPELLHAITAQPAAIEKKQADEESMSPKP